MSKRLLLVSAALVMTTAAWAGGRRPDDGDQTLYDTRPVQRGSPANPNPAFAPPRFEDDAPIPAPAPRPARSDTINPGATAAPQARTMNENSSESAPEPTPVKRAPASSAGPYEPPLPDDQ